jgi:hypothetical protein
MLPYFNPTKPHPAGSASLLAAVAGAAVEAGVGPGVGAAAAGARAAGKQGSSAAAGAAAEAGAAADPQESGGSSTCLMLTVMQQQTLQERHSALQARGGATAVDTFGIRMGTMLRRMTVMTTTMTVTRTKVQSLTGDEGSLAAAVEAGTGATAVGEAVRPPAGQRQQQQQMALLILLSLVRQKQALTCTHCLNWKRRRVGASGSLL